MNLQWNDTLRRRYAPAGRCACPQSRFVGFGQGEAVAAPIAAGPSPWALAVATSVFGAATGWVIEELARGIRGRRTR